MEDLTAAEIVAQVWCEPKNAHKTMDVDLANSFIRILLIEQARTVGWKAIAQQHCRNQEFYKGLLLDIALLLGEEAYIADDGTSSSAIVIKLPDLVAKRLKQNNDATK